MCAVVSVCGWECVSVVLSKSREAEAIREGEHESCFFFFAPLFFAFTLPLVLGFGAARVLVLLEERRVTSTHAAHRRHLRCFHHFTSRTSSCTHMQRQMSEVSAMQHQVQLFLLILKTVKAGDAPVRKPCGGGADGAVPERKPC